MKGKVRLVDGGGGEAMQSLLAAMLSKIELRKTDGGSGLDALDDAAVIPFAGRNLVFTTDSYTVSPLFFPGGDIGKLAVCGTINDLAMMGAKPLALSLAFVIGEGFSLEDLEKIVSSINKASVESGTPVVTGDTKVIDKDIGLIVNTTGIGEAKAPVRDSGLREGDVIIINGPVGDHGIALLSHREGIAFETSLESDCTFLWDLVETVLEYDVHAMKDPTRGGIANALNEMAEKSGVSITVNEESVPLRPGVRAAAEMLGIDPLTVANEGKVLLGVPKERADEVLKTLRQHPKGRDAAIIGTVTAKRRYPVTLETIVGGERILDPPEGDPVPRVC